METTSTVSPPRLVTMQVWPNLSYAQIIHMPIVLLCYLFFMVHKIAGLHCIATKLEGNNITYV